jgi:NADH:ubiquinone oxidoreductase subunit K
MAPGPRRKSALLMFVSAALTLTIAAVIYAGVIPFGDERARTMIALAVAAIAVVDAAIGLFHLTRS